MAPKVLVTKDLGNKPQDNALSKPRNGRERNLEDAAKFSQLFETNIQKTECENVKDSSRMTTRQKIKRELKTDCESIAECENMASGSRKRVSPRLRKGPGDNAGDLKGSELVKINMSKTEDDNVKVIEASRMPTRKKTRSELTTECDTIAECKDKGKQLRKKRTLIKSRKALASTEESAASDSEPFKAKIHKGEEEGYNLKDNTVSRMTTRRNTKKEFKTECENVSECENLETEHRATSKLRKGRGSRKDVTVNESQTFNAKIHKVEQYNVQDSKMSTSRRTTKKRIISKLNTIVEGKVTADLKTVANVETVEGLKNVAEGGIANPCSLSETEAPECSTKGISYPDCVSPETKFCTKKLLKISASSIRDPKQMSTYELLANPNVLAAAMNNFSDLKKRDFLSSETEYDSDSTLEYDNTNISNSAKSGKRKTNSSLGEKSSNIFALPSGEHRQGSLLVQELLSRFNDDFDLDSDDGQSSSTKGLSTLFPGYIQKKAAYDNHSKMIKELSGSDLVEHFEDFKCELLNIFQGKADCPRHQFYREGKFEKVRDMSVSIPFESFHGMIIIPLVYDFLFPKKDEYSLQHSDYISSVMVPECFIRIYSRVNGLSYHRSQLELQYGAKYNDDQLEETKQGQKN